MNFESEEKFLDVVESCLIANNCLTWREVIPDNCKSWKRPFRVDLIFYRHDIGYIGVEGKNINTLRSAKKISDAINQINGKYKNQTYFNGKTISRWCIIAPYEVDWISKEAQELMKTFLTNFLNTRYDISLMEYVANKKGSIVINKISKKKLYINETI